MTTDTITTEFAVARNGEILGDTYTDIDAARQQLAFVSDTMKTIDLDPDVELVSIDVTVTYGDPVPYVDPADTVDVPAVEAEAVDETPVDAVVETPAPVVVAKKTASKAESTTETAPSV